MLRIVLWLLLAAYLITVGLWSPAAAPVVWAFAGAGTLLAAIPGPVLALGGVIAWLKHRPAPAPTATV
ncbi:MULTISPECIES: hypothetical protein [Streptomyces]|uniref:Uncharacterized protein n=2 Tax=Streptomyces TaxID=1883 RepID=A0A2U9NZY0_STRAS|nr:hypothetical protein [Streptomyces actuosus]AWT42581.1 hypothetical protein DMT42_09810 [Streptomyces actuosus]MBM4819788.1 hypothetical protein [Streptomyces actuosus]